MILPYERDKAVAYARRWALGKNDEFGYFGGIGGDCTNYISQCLYAGCGVMNFDYLKGWYYKSMTNRSPSWTSVAFLQKFLLRKDFGVGPFGELSSLNEIEVGDIIQLRQNKTHFNHTVIVTKIVNGEFYVCAHTNDVLDKPLNQYYKEAIMPIHIVGVNV